LKYPTWKASIANKASRRIPMRSRPTEVSWFCNSFTTPSRCPVPSKCHQFSARRKAFELAKSLSKGHCRKPLAIVHLAKKLTVLWYNELYGLCKLFARESYLFLPEFYLRGRQFIYHKCENHFILFGLIAIFPSAASIPSPFRSSSLRLNSLAPAGSPVALL
jgi:hypothetical protein